MIPSLRYSCSGSPLAFPKGKTASESMTLETRCVRRAVFCPEDPLDRSACRSRTNDLSLVSGRCCFHVRNPATRLRFSLEPLQLSPHVRRVLIAQVSVLLQGSPDHLLERQGMSGLTRMGATGSRLRMASEMRPELAP